MAAMPSVAPLATGGTHGPAHVPEPGAPLVDMAEHQFWRARGGRTAPAATAAVSPRSLVRYCPHCKQDTPMVDFTTRFRCEACGNFS
jgi:hypothetical protein